MVLKPEKEAEAEAIFKQMGARLRHRRPHHAEQALHRQARRLDVMADLPIKELGDEAPVYDRPYTDTPKKPAMKASSVKPPMPLADALEKLIGNAGPLLQALGLGAVRPRHSRQHRAAAGRRRRGGAGQRRAEGAGAHRRRDAALLRGRSVRGRQAGGGGGLAQHHRGRRQAARASPTTSISAIPKSRRSWASSSAACAASPRPARRSTSRSCPATSRSTTRRKAAASCRRRRIGGVGVLADFTKSATLAFKAAGEAILLIGETQGWLGQSLYLRDVCGREEGAPPPVDLIEERENGDVVRALIGEGLVTAAHDVSDGGLLVAIAEMAMASGIGATLDAAPEDTAAACLLVRRGPGPLYRHGSGRSRRCGDAPCAGGQRAGAPARHDRRRHDRSSRRAGDSDKGS